MVWPEQNRINHFKNVLRSYQFYTHEKLLVEGKIRGYEMLINELKDSLCAGPKAVRYDKVIVQGSPDYHKIEQDRLEKLDKTYAKIEKYERKIVHYKQNIKKIDQKTKIINNFLSFCDKDIGQSAFKIYCLNDSTFQKEAEKLFIEKKTLQRRVNDEIENFFKDVLRDIEVLY